MIDSAHLAPAKDPDELVRDRGPAAWRQLLATRTCGITWRAHLLAAVTRDSPASERRAALARAGQWLGALPPRLALEQEDALRALADRCGYSTEAVQRAFQARFFRALTSERRRPAPARDDRRTEHVIER